ncbi:MAG: diguanylate cyclase [Spirochaetales bacterium]
MAKDANRQLTALEILFADPELRDALSELGVFARNLETGDGFPNYLWSDLGYTPEEMTVEFWQSIIHPEDREHALRNYRLVVAGELKTYRITYRIKSKSGEWRSIMNAGRIVSGRDANAAEVFIGSDVDVTQRQRIEDALALAKEEAVQKAQEAEALRSASAIVASTLEISETVKLVLEQARNVVPYDTATVQLLRNGALEVVGGAGWEDIDAILGLRIPLDNSSPHGAAIEAQDTLLLGDVSEQYPQFSNIAGNEIRSWIGVPLSVHGLTIGLIAMDNRNPDVFSQTHVRLATALGGHVALALQNARLYEQTKELAMTDSLTGVSSRRSFFVQAEASLAQALRREEALGVLMADLDRFKDINDELGHAAGDAAIKAAADAARTVLRKADIIGRYGGEEFAVLLPNTNPTSAGRIAERLRNAVKKVVVPGTSRGLTVSVGVAARVPVEGDTVDRILNEADQALLESKRTGRDRVTLFADAG